MEAWLELLSKPWHWTIAGPAIGLVVPLLRLAGGRRFGVSSCYRHLCSALGARAPYFAYNWRRDGAWNLMMVTGLVLGGALAGATLGSEPPAIAEATLAHLERLGIEATGALAPEALFSLAAFSSPRAWIVMLLGGLLVGFGTRWANGCTSGHAISGLAEGERASLIAVAGFFAGGLITTALIWPLLAGLP